MTDITTKVKYAAGFQGRREEHINASAAQSGGTTMGWGSNANQTVAE